MHCFVLALRLPLRLGTEHLVTLDHSFLEIVDYARTIEIVHYQV